MSLLLLLPPLLPQIERMRWCRLFMSARVIFMLTPLMSPDLLLFSATLWPIDKEVSLLRGERGGYWHPLRGRLGHGSGGQRLADDIFLSFSFSFLKKKILPTLCRH